MVAQKVTDDETGAIRHLELNTRLEIARARATCSNVVTNADLASPFHDSVLVNLHKRAHR